MSIEKFRLEDLCSSISDGDHQAPPKVYSGIPFVTISNITEQNSLDFSDTAFVPIEYYEKLDNKRKPQRNDILYSVVGSFGKVVFIKSDDKFVFQRHIAILRPDANKVNPAFLYYVMSSKFFYKIADTLALGAAQRTISLTSLRNQKVEIPSLDVQNRIAEILSRYDDLIENYQRQICLLEEAAQRLYKEWFVDLHFPGYENTRIVDGVPEGWERKSLGDITSKFATGLNPRKNFVLGKGTNYYVTIKNMSNNNVIFDDRCDRVDNEALQKINKRSDLQQGDLLFSGIGTIGRVYLIDEPVKNWNISESVFTMRPIPEIPSVFLYLLLLNKDIQDYCQSNAHGCAQKGIRMADLKAYQTLIPNSNTMKKFVQIVSKLICRTKNLSKQVILLTEARDRLLPKLMNGEIEV